jgi:archaellum biogenesis protein FlaJ (TadC family)
MEREARGTPAKGPGTTTRTSALMRTGVVLFAIGMVAVVAVFVMFAAGLQDLPIWLSAAAGVITPLGLALGLIALVREGRKSGSGNPPAKA